MNLAFAKEVAAMLNIEAGTPLYRVKEWDADKASVLRDVNGSIPISVDGHADQLIVVATGHPRGFRFKRRDVRRSEERFAWDAIHKRCSKLAGSG